MTNTQMVDDAQVRAAVEDDPRGASDRAAPAADSPPGTEVQPAGPRVLVNPATGEAINLDDDPTDIVGGFVVDLNDLIEQLQELRDLARIELTCRMDKAARWTWRGNGLEIKAASPGAGATTYDAKALRAALLELARVGEIAPEAVDAAVKLDVPDPSYKAMRGGINALLKAGNPKVAEAIDAHSHTAEGPVRPEQRKATVKRVEASR